MRSRSEGSSFSGLFTRVEMGHIVIGSDGYMMRRSCGSGSRPTLARGPVPAAGSDERKTPAGKAGAGGLPGLSAGGNHVIQPQHNHGTDDGDDHAPDIEAGDTGRAECGKR